MRWIITLVLIVAALSASLPLLKGVSRLGGLLDEHAARPAASARPGGDEQGATTGAVPPDVRIAHPGAVTVYRWRDADGTVHFETTPPPEGIGAEAIEMRRDPEVEVIAQTAPGQGRGAGPASGQAAPLTGNPLSVYSSEGMDALMQQLDGTVESLEERRRTMRDLEREL